MDRVDHDRYLDPGGSTMGDIDVGREQGRRDPLSEIRDRTRRIETRLTQTMVALGVRTDAQRPVFVEKGETAGWGRMILPSPHTSIKECLDNIPENWRGRVRLCLGDQVVGVLERDTGTGASHGR